MKILIGGLLLGASPAATAEEAPFGYASLKGLIQSHHASTLEEVIPLLPESLRANFALIFHSQSVQPATMDNPRVALFSQDGRFSVAFSTLDPSTLEVKELNPTSKKMEAHLVEFGKESTELRFIDDPGKHFHAGAEKNCARCHSPELHFIWDGYPRWPGIYGQTDKGNRKDSREALRLKRMQERLGADSVLRHLPGIESVTLAELGARNASITNALSRSNAIRISAALAENPNFLKRRAALLAALLQNKDFESFLPAGERAEYRRRYPALREDTARKIRAEYASQARRHRALGLGPSALQKSHIAEDYDLLHVATLARLRFLTEKMGLPIENWFMTRRPGSFITTSGELGLTRDLLDPIAEELRRTDPDLLNGLPVRPRGTGYRDQARWRTTARRLRDRVSAGEAPGGLPISARLQPFADHCQAWFEKIFGSRR